MTGRSDLQKAQDADKVMKLRLRGWSIAKIARKFEEDADPFSKGISRGTVHRHIKEIEAAYYEGAQDSIKLVKKREAAALEEIECEAWGDYELSKQQVRQVENVMLLANGASIKTKRTFRTSGAPSVPGDPAYLKVILDAMRRRAALFGLDQPERLIVEDGEAVELEKFLDSLPEKLKLDLLEHMELPGADNPE